MARLVLWSLLALLTLSACGGGGAAGTDTPALPAPVRTLGPADLAVLVAEGDATSEAIALAYQQARGIPAANIIRVSGLPTGSDTISAAAFGAIKSRLDAQLPAAVQATLVTWTRPSRVAGATCSMSLTSALAFGYDERYCGTQCKSTLASPYYNSNSGQPFADHGMRPSMMLGATTLQAAQALINRGKAADGARTGASSTAHAWLVRTDDPERNTRAADFQTLIGLGLPGINVHYVDNSAGTGSNVVAQQSGVMFYLTGLARVPDITTTTYLPGAVADHLTSWGGILPDARGQMPATEWLAAGATASYGTVEEPCSFAEKFPRASVLLAHYARGETLIEAYWKSVRWPGQGLFLGEPLAQPWRR